MDGRTDDLLEEVDYWITPQQTSGSVRATVIIPARDSGATLSRAIHSVMAQTLTDIEVIVVDDASTDDTWQIMLDWHRRDRRVRAMHHKHDSGKPAAMNRAIELARGRWIAVLDADDWYHPERLSALIAVGEERRADIVADNQYLYDSAARIIVSPAWPAALTNWELSLDDFQRGSNPYDVFNLGMLKPIVRADFLHARALAYETRTRQGQEYFYLLQFFLSGGRAIVCDVPYYFYSQPFGSVSRAWSMTGRKRYDFPTAIALHESYLGIAARYFTPPQLRRFKKRIRRLKALAIYATAKGLFDEGRSDDALVMLIRNPVILDYVVRRMLERIAGLSAAWTTARIAARCSRRTLRTSFFRGAPL